MIKQLLIVWLIFALIALAVSCRSQQTKKPIAIESIERTLSMNRITAMSVVAPKTNYYLMWDYNPNVAVWRVKTGPVRGTYTNSFTVSTNRVLWQSGIDYFVSPAGNENLFGLWPSNRLCRIMKEIYNDKMQLIDSSVWIPLYTNNPTEGAKFLRAREEQIGWQ